MVPHMIAADIAILLLLTVLIIVTFALRLRAIGVSIVQQEKDKLKTWGVKIDPDCETDLSPYVCGQLLSDPGGAPDPNRPRSAEVDTDAATYAVRIIGKFIAGGVVGSSPSVLQLRGMGPAVLTYSAQDPQPMAATWVAADGASAVVAVRGTRTAADVISDLQVLEVGTELPDDPAGGGTPPISVHKGIYDVYNSVSALLSAAIPSTVKSIFIAGHSMGAAIAFYYALDAARAGLKVEVWGIAPPRAGNRAFADELARSTRATAVINLADVVPTLPWSYMPGAPNEYATIAPAAVFNNLKSDITSCHTLPAYYEGVVAGPVMVPALAAGSGAAP